MNKRLELELWGPCSEDGEAQPELNDTIALIAEDGRVRFVTISGASKGPDGVVLYATGGERIFLEQCYIPYISEPSATE